MSVARRSVSRLPTEPGVYRFRDERGRALYVGRAVDLRRRVASYWTGLRDRPHLRRMVPRIEAVEAVTCDSEHEAAWLERNLLERSKPYWNRVRGGMEVPVYLRLDRTGLSLVHTADATTFGPYLGGNKVRLAASGLNRVLPVAYASERLRGSLREMGRVLGVDPSGHDALAGTVTAVLRREPEAVEWIRAELARRRDGAAGDLAFELAAKLQQELEAVEWVVSTQRMSLMDTSDLDVYGWADGILVRFEIRAGRMCTFTLRDCTQDAARTQLGRTPPAWVPFAQRNAELAARLRTRTAP